jgi:integrase
MAGGDAEILSGARRPPEDFPPRYPQNVEDFKITRRELKDCKRLATRSALEKNKRVRRVDGRELLRVCREEVDAVVAGSRCVGPVLVLSLMLLTGRRTCELVNGRSSFAVVGEHAVSFSGQAKRRGGDGAYNVPCLHSAAAIVAAFSMLKGWLTPPHPREGVSANQTASQMYQSWLRRTMLQHPVLRQAGKVHALRGLYARMAYRLFDWGDDYSEAFVVMQVLGHAGLGESLVYTAFHIGEFGEEAALGTFQNFEREALALGPLEAEVSDPSLPSTRRDPSLMRESIC